MKKKASNVFKENHLFFVVPVVLEWNEIKPMPLTPSNHYSQALSEYLKL